MMKKKERKKENTYCVGLNENAHDRFIYLDVSSAVLVELFEGGYLLGVIFH